MSETLEEIAGSYVARTESRDSAYFSQTVKRIVKALHNSGFTDGSDPKKLRKATRRALEQEQAKTAAAAVGKAMGFAGADCLEDDMVQEAWLESLEMGASTRPKGNRITWAGVVKQMKSPVSVPFSIARMGDWVPPLAVPLSDAAVYRALGAVVPRPEVEVDVRDAFMSLSEELRQDLYDLVVCEEPLLEFAKRKRIDFAESSARKERAVTALGVAFDNH